MKLPENVSEAIKKLNPALYPVGAVGGVIRESGPKPALVQNPQSKPRGKKCLPVVIRLISCRHRLVDDDNSISGGNKALRDAIARSLGIDDADPRVRWEYSQCHTSGEEGTIVCMETPIADGE